MRWKVSKVLRWRKLGSYLIVASLALSLCMLTSCTIIGNFLDRAFGISLSGDGDGWLDVILKPIQSVPGPIGLGADLLVLLGGLWAGARGKRWKDLASDSVSLINRLKNSPEGLKLWAELKPRLDAAKGRKKLKEISKVYSEIREFLKEQDKA